MANNGILGEAAAVKYFIQNGYDVFTQFSGKEPFDLVVHKDGVCHRVSVKSTSYKRPSGSYAVPLRRIRNNSKTTTVHLFDNTSCDLLACYILPEDKLIVVKASDISTSTELNIRLEG